MSTREVAYAIVSRIKKLLGIHLTPGQFWKLKFAVMDILEAQ